MMTLTLGPARKVCGRGTALALSLTLFFSGITSAQTSKRDLFLMHGDADLVSLLRGQLVDWSVQTGTGATPGSSSDGAAVTVDGSGEGLSAVVEYAGQLRMSPLPPRSEPGWERVFVLVVEGLLLECERAAEVAATVVVPHESAIAPSSLPQIIVVRAGTTPAALTEAHDEVVEAQTAHRYPRTGWVLRLGIAHGQTPIANTGSEAGAFERDPSTFYTSVMWGIRVSVGRWVTPYLRIDLTGHGAMDEFGLGPEGAVGAQAMLLSRSFFRVGIGLETSVIFAREGIGGALAVRPQVGMPFEMGFDFGSVGGLFGHFTPSYTHSTYAVENFGYLVSAEWEIPLG